MIFVRQASYHLEACKCKNLRAFDFFIIEQNMFKWDIGNSVFDNCISWRCLKTLIGLLLLVKIIFIIISDNLLIIKFRNSKCDLKDSREILSL